ncbi:MULTISPECIES: bis(5'-nucleosyl)-tetraphosphatase (symmetrical) YqeK [unclassified Paenibacillus]|uniref:bis(5'-nucleosyl)-tetraphosphatase (symmetrical) YqeK n=1 Tax=unclassified Paenibacillus TaxID=185978 RepID=UPI001F32C84B|nr:bis(5'-nucleosyl)-tetraphosphatase (symmetrical) YqeK [Paenibacillus sp. JJ-223]CAH1211456.1 hypothetical protein PAECIP111890_03737 [Paenibacillus sp. JJ-223]
MMHQVLETYSSNVLLSGNVRNDIQAFFSAHHDLETLNHTLIVATQARHIAELYGADPWKAEQAGLLHDISNVVPVSEMLNVAKVLSIDIMDEEYTYDRIVHQKLSKAMAKEIFYITDSEILDAIECHTTFRPEASLMDKVLFVSDKISWELPGNHAYLHEIRKKVEDEQRLDEGILIYLNYIWEQRSKLKLVHPWLIQAREELLQKGLCI